MLESMVTAWGLTNPFSPRNISNISSQAPPVNIHLRVIYVAMIWHSITRQFFRPVIENVRLPDRRVYITYIRGVTRI